MEAAFTIITRHASTWILTAALVSVSSTYVAAQVAGTTTIGVAVAEVDIVAKGWSAKKHILGEPVFNEKSEKVGKIHDLIVAPDKSVSYAIVGTGTFAGLPKHDVAIPVSQFQEKDGKFILAGATKAAIKALPPFEYAKAGKWHTKEMAAHPDGKH